MSYINSNQTLRGIAVCFICLVSACPLMAADRPNIIFVLCDDLGAGDIGILWQNGREGPQKFSTPNLDQFASEGQFDSELPNVHTLGSVLQKVLVQPGGKPAPILMHVTSRRPAPNQRPARNVQPTAVRLRFLLGEETRTKQAGPREACPMRQ